jgi:hypothetical protein
MKLVIWDDDDVPAVEVLPTGDGMVADSKYFYNLEIGDQVQYRSEEGTSCYFVVDKQPFEPVCELSRDLFHVTIQKASL